MKMARDGIQRRLAAGFGICVLLMVALVGYNVTSLKRLERLYQETLRRQAEMELATGAQHIGAGLYRIIADAVINREIGTTERDWASGVRASRDQLHRLAAAADSPEELAGVRKAERALAEMAGIFEQEMLPLIRKGGQVPGPLAEIDDRIDDRVSAVAASLQAVARCISADNSRVSREFHAVLTESIALAVTLSLTGVVAALFISALTTRRIVRPLQEITRAAREIERGNYGVELRHRSEDETGVLANAFRGMAQRVAGHTVELQEANRRLNIEVEERRVAEEQVSRLNAELEKRVEERTAELVRANAQYREALAAQQQAREELQRSRAELRSLSGHLEEVREEERTAIAREIHDELGQLLTAMKIDLAWLGKRLPPELAPLLDKTRELTGHVDATIATVQRISAELRPGILDDLGLAAAVEWQAQEFEKKTGIGCTVRIGHDCAPLDRRRSTVLFRIFQEGLTNIYRHAGATAARLALSKDGATLVATVTDNGRGVPEEKIADPRSLGFIGMRERVQQFGGEVTVKRLAQGTRLRVLIPLEGNDEVTL